MLSQSFKTMLSQIRLPVIYRNSYSFCSREDEKRRRENVIADKLKQELQASFVDIKDTSVRGSACGTMYKMVVVSPQFDGISRVQQHQLVTEILKEELKEVHGYNLKTMKPGKVEPQSQSEE